MADRPIAEDARSQLACGLSLFVPAITAHTLVFVNNVGYVFHYFGNVMLVAYFATTAAAIAWPHVTSLVGTSLHTKVTGWIMSIFILYITIEENFHTAKNWHAPEGTSRVLAAFGVPEVQAKAVALGLVVLLGFLAIELLSHFLHTGYHLTHDAHCKIRASKRRHEQHEHHQHPAE